MDDVWKFVFHEDENYPLEKLVKKFKHGQERETGKELSYPASVREHIMFLMIADRDIMPGTELTFNYDKDGFFLDMATSFEFGSPAIDAEMSDMTLTSCAVKREHCRQYDLSTTCNGLAMPYFEAINRMNSDSIKNSAKKTPKSSENSEKT